jgi:hypothetical protein
MAQNKVQLLVELIGKDGVTKLLDSAATEALKLERRMKKGQKASNMLATSVNKIRDNWSEVTVGLNAGIELFGKLSAGAQAVQEAVKETARARQVEKRFVDQLNVSVEKLAAASAFQMSDIEIKKFALQAKNAGITMAQFEQILQVATKAAAGTGKEFAEVFEGLFVDTIIGASDSYTEQLGIVFDLGVETENYARKNFIAKDKIDKTTQSSAALNVVLGKVGAKFKDIKVDDFSKELSKAQRRVEQLKDELSKAGAFLAQDVMDALGVTKTGQAVMDQYAALNKELQKFANGHREVMTLTAKGTDEVGVEVDLTAKKVSGLKQELGKLAKSSEDVRRLIFQDLTREAREQAEAVSELETTYTMWGEKIVTVNEAAYDSERNLNAFDQALIKLADQYGLADVAQKEFTTGAQMMASVFGAQVPRAISQATGVVAQFAAEARSSLSTFITDPNFAKALEGDEAALLALFGIKKGDKDKKKPKRKGGARKKYEDQAQRDLRKVFNINKKALTNRKLSDDALLAQMAKAGKQDDAIKRERLLSDEKYVAAIKNYLKLNADNQKAGQERMQAQLRLHLEAEKRLLERQQRERAMLMQIDDSMRFDGDDGFGEDDPFQWMDASEMRMAKLADAMVGITDAARAMDKAVASLGLSPGFTNMTQQVNNITKASMKFADTNKKTTGTYADLTGAIVSGAGQAALGFVEGERERAAIMAVMETAQAGVMFAKFAANPAAANYAVAGTMHLANAAMFTAIAGGAGGKKGGGAGGGAGAAAAARTGMRDIPQLGQQQPGQQIQPAQVVVNMSGAIVAGANRKKTANDLGALVQESMGNRR